MEKKDYARYAPELNELWRRFLDRFGVEDTTAPTVLATLRKRYGGTDRHYHSLAHIVHLLCELRRLRAEKPEWFTHPVEDAAIELALWFHDFIYDTTRGDNERESGRLAELYALRLGFSRAVGQRAKDYARATDHRKFARDFGAQLVCDLDLLSLAAPEHEFDENTRLIRLEYGHVSDAAWRRGRRAWAKAFLENRPSVYQTRYYFERCETPARANLERMIEELSD